MTRYDFSTSERPTLAPSGTERREIANYAVVTTSRPLTDQEIQTLFGFHLRVERHNMRERTATFWLENYFPLTTMGLDTYIESALDRFKPSVRCEVIIVIGDKH